MKTHLIILVFVHCLLLLPTVIYSQGVAINTVGTEADPSAMLDVSSTEKGVLVTRMSTVQRDAISSPAQGLLIYNTTTQCFEFYDNSNWYSLGCTCTLPDIPVAIAGSGATATQVTANWNSATGATSYNLDVSTVSDFSSFVAGYNDLDVGAVTTYDVTGLTCETTYYYRIRAVNSCGTTGNSNVITITSASCGYSQMCLAVGGAGIDYGYSIIQTTDGGYAIAGSTNSYGAGGNDLYVVKLDGSATIQWTRTVGGAGTNDDGKSIIQSSDGGYVIAGRTNSYGAGGNDFYVVKLDGSGTVLWTRTIGGGGSDDAYSITKTTDGGYALLGTTGSYGAGGSDLYVVKLDGSGTVQWTKTVGSGGGEGGLSQGAIIQATDGGYAITGSTSIGAGGSDIYIVKLDGSGTLLWTRTIGGASGDWATSIIQTTDGGYAVSGITPSFGAGSEDFYIVKLDGSGTVQWNVTVGGTGQERTASIVQTDDGGYVIGGGTNSFGAGSWDFYLVKLDGSGVLQWTRTVGTTGFDFCLSLIKTSDGGYAMAGFTDSFGMGSYDIYIVKLDGSNPANTCCSMASGGTSGTGGSISSGGSTGSGGTSGSGGTTGSGGVVTINCGN